MLDNLMVQQQLRGPYKKWKHMVAVMCLNLTYRKQVKAILPRLFKKISKSCCIHQGQAKDTGKITQTTRYVESENQKVKKYEC